MASSTLLYIAWPVTLGLSFMAGSMILSNEPSTEKPKDGNQSSQVARRNSSSNGSTNETSAATNRRSSATRSRAGKDGYAESYDIKEIANTNDPQKRLTNLLRMIDQLGPGDFEQVVADFRELGMTEERMAEYGLLLNAWAKVNPEGALAYAKENTKSSFASVTILSAWAGYSPDAAIQWVKLNHEGDKANPYLVGIIKGIASSNPERATDILQDLPFGRERGEALRAILPHVSKLGTEKAIAWLATIKDEKLRAGATATLASSLAKKDPQATADWLKTLSADTLKASAGSVAKAWAEQDLDKAVEWTNSLEGQTRTNAASQMMRQFVSSDPNKAATWMKTMSADPGYERVVRTFMFSTGRDHPEVALANLDQVGDDWRDRSQQMILMGWAAKDKGAATQWMQTNSMDAAAQEKVLSTAAKGYGRHWGRDRK